MDLFIGSNGGKFVLASAFLVVVPMPNYGRSRGYAHSLRQKMWEKVCQRFIERRFDMLRQKMYMRK